MYIGARCIGARLRFRADLGFRFLELRFLELRFLGSRFGHSSEGLRFGHSQSIPMKSKPCNNKQFLRVFPVSLNVANIKVSLNFRLKLLNPKP